MLVYTTLIIKSVTALVFLCLLLLFCNMAFYIVFYFCSIFGLGYLAIVTDVRAMEVLLRLLDSNGIGEIFNILINTSDFDLFSLRSVSRCDLRDIWVRYWKLKFSPWKR